MYREPFEDSKITLNQAETVVKSVAPTSLGRVVLGRLREHPVLSVVTDEGICVSFLLSGFSGHEHNLYCQSVCEKYFIKIEIKKYETKKNNLAEEAAILKHLTEAGCQSAPRYFWDGEANVAVVEPLLARMSEALKEKPATVHLMLSEFVGDTESTTMADILCAIMEQKALGVYQGDLKPDNIRYCPNLNRTFLIDYDQATLISDDVKSLNGLEFMGWCDRYAHERYAEFPHLQRAFGYFPDVQYDTHIEPHFVNGVFNIGETSMFKLQETTLNPNKIYHTWDTPHVFAQGERALDERIPWLDQVDFEPGERVLDVGCNAGLLSRYLDQRGCAVTGIDIDPNVITGAKILANLHGDSTEFHHVDLDQQPILGYFDTVMLFSVIHHTDKIFANCKKVSSSAKRILIECRFREGGLKPLFDGRWKTTTTWQYGNLEEMKHGLEGLFKGFKVKRTFGPGDRDRFLLELVKQ